MNRLIVITILILVPWTLFAQINWIEHYIDTTFERAYFVYAIDVDNDDDIDVLGSGDLYVIWWENDGNQNFIKHTIDSTFRAFSIYAIDMEPDGDIDVVGADYHSDEIFWWENDGDEHFTGHIIGNFGSANSVYAIDMDNDNDVDVLGAAQWGTNLIAWWENDGNENFTIDTIASNYLGANSVYAIDMEPDGDVDVLGAARSDDEITWWENDGDENFTEYTIGDYFDYASSVYAIDIEPDGDSDVLGAAWMADDICLWQNDGSENFIKRNVSLNFNGACYVYAIDMDNDNDVDVLGAAMLADDIIWWENDGNQNFIKHTIDSTFRAFSIYAIDMDNDGDVDVLGAATDAGDIVWWESDLATVNVAPVSIDIPSTLPEDTTINPQATAKNFGTYTETFDIICEIDPGAYTSTETVTDLASCDSLQVTFSPDFTFVSGIYTVKIYTQLAGDDHPENDTLEKIIETYAPGIAEEDLDMSVSFSFGLKSNPTKGKAIFNLSLPKNASITLEIYDASGRRIATPITGMRSSGNYTITWTPKTNAGVYFYALKSPWGNETGKILFVR